MLGLAIQSKHPGADVPLIFDFDHTLAWCETEDELGFHRDSAIERGFLTSTSREVEVCISAAGWDFVDKIRSSAPFSADLVFVAMSFNSKYNDVWSAGLRPGIELAGYRAERADSTPHAGRIDDRIIAMLRECRMAVVDVTSQNQGAYFEAGFALGLGRPVIWTVQEDDLKNLHFDTRQFLHVVWSDAEDLRFKTRDRLHALFGRGPVKII